MPRDPLRDTFIAWTIGLLSLAAAAALLVGCARDLTTGPTNAVEDALIAETARFAGILRVNVRGEITTERLNTPQGWATGWYKAGVAYYNREMVAQGVSLEPEPWHETATNVAAHEVAHAIYYAHDISHWCCTKHAGATPTYPPPIAGAVCDGRAERCLSR